MSNVLEAFPGRFPYDLEYIIIRTAVRDNGNAAAQLALVSKEIHKWVDPSLYRHVLLKNRHAVERFSYAISSKRERDPLFFACVETLSLPFDTPLSVAAIIFTHCVNVINLQCDMLILKNPPETFFGPLELLRPRQISFYDFSSYFAELDIPFLEEVTHAHFGDDWEDWIQWDFRGMPKLTHLALNMRAPYTVVASTCRGILEACPQLKVLVMIDDYPGSIYRLVGDSRVVVMEESYCQYDWKQPFEGKVRMWSDAEATVNRQKHRLERQMYTHCTLTFFP